MCKRTGLLKTIHKLSLTGFVSTQFHMGWMPSPFIVSRPPQLSISPTRYPFPPKTKKKVVLNPSCSSVREGKKKKKKRLPETYT